jgi:phage FluMu gp28-like protein
MDPATPKPIVNLLSYQKRDVESRARFRWSCWGRQTGKSFTKSLRRILRGLHRGRSQVFLSASERQSRELMQKARQHCHALQVAARHCKSRLFEGMSTSQLEIALPNGIRIIGLPANPQTIRGFTGDVLLDEFAMHADDREIWASIFPTLLRGDGELDVASTPKGKSNVFYELASNERFERDIVTLHDAVAQGLRVDVEAIRASMGDDELFRQEFLCEFLDETTAFLTYEQIAACEDRSLEKETQPDRLADAGAGLFAGVDVGRKRDLTVIWVLWRDGERLVTRAVYEHRNLPFRDQYERLSEILRLPELRRCCIDAGGIGMQLAESAVEDFGPHRVEPITFTSVVKNELATKLRIAVEEARLSIPVDAGLRNDWHSVRRSVSPTGVARYDADRSLDGHADRFWAAALAVRAAGNEAGPVSSLNVKPLAFAREGTW